MVKSPRKPPQTLKADQAAETIASFAPPPHWVEPCIPTLVAKPPKDDRWRHEVKWDGYRVCVVIDAGKAKVRTRRGHDWSDKSKPIAAAAAALPCHNAIIDGEAVVLDARGRASFSALRADSPAAARAPCSTPSTASFSTTAICASFRSASAVSRLSD
jgi:bifunctional non-homologous end joining protein LigD